MAELDSGTGPPHEGNSTGNRDHADSADRDGHSTAEIVMLHHRHSPGPQTNRPLSVTAFYVAVACWLLLFPACAAPHRELVNDLRRQTRWDRLPSTEVDDTPQVALTSHHAERDSRDPGPSGTANSRLVASAPPAQQIPFEALPQLEALALTSNPTLQRLRQQVEAAKARADYVGKLPDPAVGANVFVTPIETAAGSQRANLTVMQLLPWLARLDAQTQQACLEAMAIQQKYEVERLKVISDLRSASYRLYVIGKEIESTRANQELLKNLIDAASGMIDVGRASPADVRLGTVEYGKLEERLLTLRQQLASTKAELNRLVGRDAAAPVQILQQLNVTLPEWSHAMLRQLALDNQPAIAAAQIRARASQWGIEVARLRRRPDLTLSASWFAIEDNRLPSSVVNVGEDAWSLGAQITIPLWRRKYDAMEREAHWKEAASLVSVEEVTQRVDALLRDLWEQARSAHETAELYRGTILPEAKQTLDVDTRSYAEGTVQFDRVLQDFGSLLTLELGYHRAIGQLATALARIQQVAAVELTVPGSSPLAVPGV